MLAPNTQPMLQAAAAGMRRSLPAILVVVLGLVWGLQYSSAKLAGAADLESAESLFVIHLLLALIFLPVLFWKGKEFIPTLSELAFFALLGFIGNIMQFGLQIAVAPFITAGELTLIVSLTPIFIVVMVAILRTEPFCFRRVAAIGLGLAATFAMIVPDAAATAGRSPWVWLTAALGVPFAAATAIVMMAKFWPKRLSPLQVTAGNITAVAVMLLPVVLWQGGGNFSFAGGINAGAHSFCLHHWRRVLPARDACAAFRCDADLLRRLRRHRRRPRLGLSALRRSSDTLDAGRGIALHPGAESCLASRGRPQRDACLKRAVPPHSVSSRTEFHEQRHLAFPPRRV
ncbi:MAG: DMT family transporter [Rhizobiales bacterium]|nr:DMT family transporter [Hyphomicrobiales bacterium]